MLAAFTCQARQPARQDEHEVATVSAPNDMLVYKGLADPNACMSQGEAPGPWGLPGQAGPLSC